MYRTLTLTFVVLALAAGTTAQEDGCTQEQPCPLDVAVDELGFSGQTDWNVTVGDWYTVEVTNLDLDADHRVSLESYGASWDVASIESESRLIHFDAAGDFQFTDEPTGDFAIVHVLTVDAVAFEQGVEEHEQTAGPSKDTGADGKGAPGAPLLMGGLALLGLALWARR